MKRKVLTMLLAVTMSATVGSPVCAADFTSGTENVSEFSENVMDSENADDYLEWCRSHSTDPSDESAEFYVEQTDIEQMDRQVMDDDSYGIWN